MKKLEEKVKNKIDQHILDRAYNGRVSICAEDNLDHLGLDSLDVVDLCMDVEKELNICISDLEVEKLETVGDVYSCVSNLIK